MTSLIGKPSLRMQDSWWCTHRLLCCVVVVSVCGCPSVPKVFSCELRESSLREPDVFRRHLVGSCTSDEHKQFAVSSDDLFLALREGKRIDLRGVMIIGDLQFDQLPLQPMNSSTLSSAEAQQIAAARHIQNGRVIQGSLVVRDSVIEGNWATNLRDGLILILGETDMTGTRFTQSLDFSKTAFLKTVNFSDSTIQYEGFFIGSYFHEDAIFANTTFGTHSRFHKAQFHRQARFGDSQFRGLAEFLEVMFEQGASFVNAQFQMGTGFSGARFGGPTNFSRSQFTREAYFRFAIFEQEANFQAVSFREVSDFTDATFAGHADFDHVEFLMPSNFSRTSLEGTMQEYDKNKYLRERLSLGFAILGVVCILIWGVMQWRQLR